MMIHFKTDGKVCQAELISLNFSDDVLIPAAERALLPFLCL
jgi:hypothetical protein